MQFLDDGCDPGQIFSSCFSECFLCLRVFKAFRVVRGAKGKGLRRSLRGRGG